MTMPKEKRICGVYVIFGPRGVYVGESGNIIKRLSEYVIRLGFDWTVVRYLSPTTKKADREIAERAVMTAYRRAGVEVLSQTREDVGKAWQNRFSPEERSARGRYAGSFFTAEQGRLNKLKDRRTPAERSESARRAYANRSPEWKKAFAEKGRAARNNEARRDRRREMATRTYAKTSDEWKERFCAAGHQAQARQRARGGD